MARRTLTLTITAHESAGAWTRTTRDDDCADPHVRPRSSSNAVLEFAGQGDVRRLRVEMSRMQRNERSTGQIETQPPSNTLTPLVLESTNTSRMRRERGLDTNSKTRLHPDCTTTMLGSELSGVRRRSPAYTGCWNFPAPPSTYTQVAQHQ
ncbi:hypothetical protein DFP72DRAFT_399881 [Ephemerocybe angulata]|uniref:Uncharacterized protein n=1 Tax=Ephemerocybe angulata TaxID=980116 RepID=A0A8H6M2Y2_9AGAR|nr:hypothetical protein DFP72DRAFT_399881 [Tulosesus angulatus]